MHCLLLSQQRKLPLPIPVYALFVPITAKKITSSYTSLCIVCSYHSKENYLFLYQFMHCLFLSQQRKLPLLVTAQIYTPSWNNTHTHTNKKNSSHFSTKHPSLNDHKSVAFLYNSTSSHNNSKKPYPTTLPLPITAQT